MKKVLTTLLLLGMTSTFLGQNTPDSTNPSNHEGWKLSLIPNLWFAGASGDIGFRDQTVPVEASFKDVLENLKMGFLMHAEATNGKWIIMGDIVYLKIVKEGNIALLSLSPEITLKQTIGELAGGYTLLNSEDRFFIDGFAGLRYFEVDNVIETANRDLLDRTINTTDPILGIRLRTASEKWQGSLRADLGGFGIGSELSWKSNLIVGYRFSDLFTLHGGFQVYGLDYEKDDFTLNVTSAGFALGFEFEF